MRVSFARQERAAKRELLIAAAADLLRSEGVSGCTVRAVAARAGLSKSSVHYYLEDVDELVDLAFDRLMGQFIDLMGRTAASAVDPFDRLWAAVDVYMRLGASRRHRIPMMTFEVLIAASRQGRVDTIKRVMDAIVELFRQLMADTGIEDATRKADVLTSALVGILVRDEISSRPIDDAVGELADVLGLPPPMRRVTRSPTADLSRGALFTERSA